MKNMGRKLLLTANVLGLIMVLIAGLMGVMCYSTFVADLTELLSASVGVIGGDDGPTAVFVSGGFDMDSVLLILLLSLMLMGSFFGLNVTYFIRKK
ncbi:MAG: hypothetical protein JXC36_05030 [Candidatus Atribacteria bacterium]|nr:hypothetical protein [Candidatus Atribacteria bacterium]